MKNTRYLNPKRGEHAFAADPDARRPNLFVITVDMIPPEAYQPECPLRQHLHTPAMDRLMSDGVRFSNAFTASPLCGPSRACTLTGRYPYLTVNEERAHDGWETSLRCSDAIYPEYLSASGYLTKHAGKCHVGAAKFLDAFGENDAPWDRWAPPMADDDGYLRYLDGLGVQPPIWLDPVRGLRPDRTTPGNSYGGWITQPDGSEFPLEATYSRYLAWLAEQKLDAAMRQASPGQPIYLQLDFFAPHQPFFVPECFRDRARELEPHIKLPESYDEALAMLGSEWPRVYGFYLRNWGLYPQETARQYMLMNMLQVEALDTAIGAFIKALDRRGLYADSAIILSGDHGEMNCERALVDKGVYGHPKTARVPLALKLPGGASAGTVVDDLVSLVDVAPTVFELAGVMPLDRLDGESLVSVARGEGWCPERPILLECGWHVCPNPAVATFAEIPGRGGFMYTYNLTSPRDELYNLDDLSYRDLSTDAAFSDVKAEMIRRLGAILESDPRWTCYWHTFRLDKYELLDVPQGDFQMFRPEH